MKLPDSFKPEQDSKEGIQKLLEGSEPYEFDEKYFEERELILEVEWKGVAYEITYKSKDIPSIMIETYPTVGFEEVNDLMRQVRTYHSIHNTFHTTKMADCMRSFMVIKKRLEREDLIGAINFYRNICTKVRRVEKSIF